MQKGAKFGNAIEVFRAATSSASLLWRDQHWIMAAFTRLIAGLYIY